MRNTDISVLLPENIGSKDLAHEKNTKEPYDAAAEAGSAANIGGTLGWLAGLGALVVPGIGPFLGVTALAGVGAVGSPGGLTGALVGARMPEYYQAKRYEGHIKTWGSLLSIHGDYNHWEKRAVDVLKSTGAEEVSTTTEARADYARSDTPMPRTRIAIRPGPEIKAM